MVGRRRVGTVIADDEPKVRQALASLLEGTEYEVLASVADGDELVNCLTEHRPTLVITDMNMPAGGPGIVSRVGETRPGTVVVAMSAESSSSLVEAAVAAGAAAFWDKLGLRSLLDVLDALDVADTLGVGES
jgi:DNA-binding NarL/FixJ family response regulator